MIRRALLIFLTAICVSFWSIADERPNNAAPPKLKLEIVKEGWGGADESDIRAVLKSTARELLPHFPGVIIEPIRVSPKDGPITLFERAGDGYIRVRLNTGQTFWSQYAYQFAHELTHILCQYREADRSNQWFEETICETASLFALHRMGQSWKTNPPYRNWKSYAPSLTKYADQRIADHPLPEGETLAEWFKSNEAPMRKNAEDRVRNTTVAVVLLPLFEASPDSWVAVNHLNDEHPKAAETFQQYLQRWHDHTPRAHQAFVIKIASQFGVKLSPGGGSGGK